MAKMTKNQLIDAIAEGTQVSKGDVKAVIEQMATVGYKELNESGEFVIPGFVKMSVVNGNTGTVAATFTVSLSASYGKTVSVDFATPGGSATSGSDYQAATGTLIFAPGETSKTVTVLVNGDRLAEPNESFSVNLSSPTNATIADGQGIGTILDDEPRISISDVTKAEGKKGQTTLFTFTVTLSAACDQPVTITLWCCATSCGDRDHS